MKIFTWMQNKFNERHESKKPSLISASHYVTQEPDIEGFSERNHGLLAIGTFGKSNLKEDPERSNLEGNSSSSQDLTLEELRKLQNELNILLHKEAESTCSAEFEASNVEFYKLLDRESSSLEGERGNSNPYSDESRSNDCSHQRSTSIVLNSGKDVGLDNTKSAIGKKSLSFLLKKMFVCSSGMAPAPSLRDALPESRMEKILF